MSKKGSSFEREVCTELSLWFTDNERDDIFWRHDSGTRAKTRSRKGKATFDSYGDIKVNDPIGRPLTDLVTIELKNGYGKWSFLDVLDHPPMQWNQKQRTKQTFENFLDQVNKDSIIANTYPVIIAKRDKRRKVIIFPKKLFSMIEENCGKYTGFSILITPYEYIKNNFVAISFDQFKEWCSPSFFIDYEQKNKRRKSKYYAETT